MAQAGSYDFNGIYFGAHAVLADSEIDFSKGGSLEDKGLFGGFQTGFNVIDGNLMYGAESDLSISDADLSGTCPYNGSLSCDMTVSPMFTVRPRVGYVTGNWLFYATGGVAVMHLEVDARDAGGTRINNARFSEIGLTAGFGIEHMLGSTVGVKAEYRYSYFGDVEFDSKTDDSKVSADLDMYAILIGVNWHF